MSTINDTGVVKKQYESSSNLSTRISIHDKYSTNKMGFGNWIFSNYSIEKGSKVLELGCGTADMWLGREKDTESFSQLILSDFSEGMLKTARSKTLGFPNVEYKVIDIQDIPYEANTFDVVIANMMLYHVPNIDMALKEVARVLKDTGSFYCATYGEHGIIEFLSGLLGEYGVVDTINKNFTLQNGEKILSAYFNSVIRKDYEDSLAVTNITDIVDYIYSLESMSALSQVSRNQVEEVLLKHTKNGVLNIPKEYGMFISRKEG